MTLADIKPGQRFQFKETPNLSKDIFFEDIGDNNIAFDKLVLTGDEEVILEDE